MNDESTIIEPSFTATREDRESATLVPGAPPTTPLHVPIGGPPFTSPSCDPDNCLLESRHVVPLPLTPASSTCETHNECRLPIPPTASVISPFSIPWIIEEDGTHIDLTPSEPAIVVEQSKIFFSPDKYQYWIRVIGIETKEGTRKATQMIRELYINKIVYLESVEFLDQCQLIHATWTALIMWRKTGTISGLLIGCNPLHMRTIKHRDPPFFDPFTPSLPRSPVLTDKSFPLPPVPTRPTITIEKNDMNRCWITIVDMEPIAASTIITTPDSETATETIKNTYIGKMVYLEWVGSLQGWEYTHATWTALMTWYKTGYQVGLGLRIGKTPIDVVAIDPKPLYEPPFKLTDIPDYEYANISLIPMEELISLGPIMLSDGSLSQNVDVVMRKSENMDAPPSLKMILKKMTAETTPDDMINEAQKYVALRECNHAPKLLGVAGNAETGDCRGLLIEFKEGMTMFPIPFMFNNMRLEITMKLLKAMVEFEEKGVYHPDLIPSNVILTLNDDVCIIDFGRSYTDGFYPEERLHELVTDTITIKTAMYVFLMLLRFIWNEGVVLKDSPPPPPLRLRDRCPARLLSLLDNPDAAKYSSFRELQEVLQQEPAWERGL